MDNIKIGQLIYRLRKENNMTQLQLANQMNISDKAISKWERGLGCPDVSLLPDLSRIFNVDLEKLLSGELDVNEILYLSYLWKYDYRNDRYGHFMLWQEAKTNSTAKSK